MVLKRHRLSEALRTLPLYEYRCTQCGNRFEKIQSFKSKPLTECPKCGGPLVRPLTAPALQFKGAGWYVNDYAGKSSNGGASTDSSTSTSSSAETKSGSASSASAASDSKPSTPAASS